MNLDRAPNELGGALSGMFGGNGGNLPPGVNAWLSGGLFPGGGQQRIVEFRDAQLAADITALAVTDEPAGGSTLPTGHKFLIGSSRG